MCFDFRDGALGSLDWYERPLDNGYHPKYSGKFPKGSKIKSLKDLSKYGGTVKGEVYTVLGYNRFGTVYLEELGYKRGGYGVTDFELIKEEKDMNTFDIKDLKTGNRITFEDGSQYIVFLNTPQNYREAADDFIVAANGSCSWEYLSKVDFDEITKVEIPNHPYVLVRISTSSEEYTTIWEKPVPLTPEQIKQQELQARYDAAKKELEELGKALGVAK